MWSLDFFKELTKVPRPSFYEEQVVAYLKKYAESQGYTVKTDAVGNLSIFVEAQGSGIGKDTVALQAHVDMVCVSEPGREIDFLHDGLSLYEEDGFLKAKGTTLGADDGIGVALAFYCATLPNHPPLEIVLTVQEEVGMHGAAAVTSDFFQAKRLISLDNPTEHALINGCAGGSILELKLASEADTSFSPAVMAKVQVNGLLGGHSGIDIHLGRLPANKVLVDFLEQLTELSIAYRLAHMSVGMARNAIARDGFIEIGLEQENDLPKIQTIQSRLTSGAGENVSFEISIIEQASYGFITKSSEEKLRQLLKDVPHGVVAWLNEATVRTSNNLATIGYDGKEFTIITFHRSAFKDDLATLHQEIISIAKRHGATTQELGETTPWPPHENGVLQTLIYEIYRDLYPEQPMEINVVHAGFECGYWELLRPGMDMISMGPNTFDLHSPQERLDLQSLARVENWLKHVMEQL
ncbi:beta-Ala-His dipeptidase [Entomospira entomophila]|uniref:Aminoacyl-histidine dipeptidase n=1 Tax=Entomospira entomophila TaxID=2719988 RepID=A0A968GDN9_9SPIO|nr:beta-Ala-His dipeptidase [Entomospira entomophilus]NIZ40519.1 aminoacyl-histidine dipeptidase [Entomospira entomophilus]WDI36077.1 beta-Ala-His dipeptidase [Entomospira entomophilus]